MRPHRLGRSQGAGRRHGAEPGADLHDQRGIRAAPERRGPARHHPAVGDAVQRHARPLRAARGPRLPGARAARHHGLGDHRASIARCGTSSASRSGSRYGGCSAGAAPRDCRPMPRAAGPGRTRSASSCWAMSRPAGSARSRCGSASSTATRAIRRARVHAAREALGPEIGLMCDAHGTLSVAEAKRFCRLVEDCNLAWFEEPVTADDKRGQAQVRAVDRHPDRVGRERVHPPRFPRSRGAERGRHHAARSGDLRRHHRGDAHLGALPAPST